MLETNSASQQIQLECLNCCLPNVKDYNCHHSQLHHHQSGRYLRMIEIVLYLISAKNQEEKLVASSSYK